MRFQSPKSFAQKIRHDPSISRQYNRIILQFIIVIIFTTLLCYFFYFPLYDPSSYLQSCAGSSLSNWSKAEFYFLIASTSLALFDIRNGLRAKKNAFCESERLKKFHRQYWILVFLMFAAQFVLWIGLFVSYWQTTVDCGKLSSLVFYLVLVLSVVYIGIFNIWFWMFFVLGDMLSGLGGVLEGTLNFGYKLLFH